MVNQPDFEPKGESSIHIQSGPIYDEISRDLVVWQQNPTSDFAGNFGPRVRLEKFSPLLGLVSINVGTGFLSKHTPFAGVDLSAGFHLNEQAVKSLSHGYLDVPLVKILSEALAVKRLANISLRDRYLDFKLGSQFSLYLGPSSLEEALETWQQGKIGTAPTFNPYLSLSLGYSADRQEFPQNREQFIQLCTQFSTVLETIVGALHQLYDKPMPKFKIEILSPHNQRQKDQQERGYSITTYQEGEFHWDGSKADPIYDGLDRLGWEKDQEGIFQNRGLGNRQIVTISTSTDRLVFGRWAGLSAGDQQADVLIDQDVSNGDLAVKGERAVSRRHFAVYFSQEINKVSAEESKGLVQDIAIVEDLHSLNGLKIFRRTSLARAIFKKKHEELTGGQWSFILPGDLLLITAADYKEKNLGEFDWFMPKSIGLVYLGNRRFVKLLIAPGATSGREFLKELVSVIASAGEVGRMQDLVNQLTDPARKINNLDQFVHVVRDFQINRRVTPVELTNEMVAGETTDDLLHILGAANQDSEMRYNNARRIIEQRREPHLVSYALLQLTQEAGIGRLTDLLMQSDLWKKISAEVCLHVLDLVETGDVDLENKKQIIHAAFMARDDLIRDIIRPRLERY